MFSSDSESEEPKKKKMEFSSDCSSRGSDSDCMSKYLAKVNQSGLQIPESIRFEDFLPAGAPLLDFLAVSMDRMETWKLPPRDEISFYQRARGLSRSMIDISECCQLRSSPWIMKKYR